MGPWKITDEAAEFELEVFAKKVIVVILILSVVAVLWIILPVLLMAFIGALIAIMVQGLANLVNRYLRVQRGFALPVVLILLFLLGGCLVWLTGSRISEQFAQFTSMIPTSKIRLDELLRRYPWGRFILDSMKATKWDMTEGLQIFTSITKIATSAVDLIVGIVVIMFAAIYFSLNPDIYIRGMVALVPKGKSLRFGEVLEETASALRYWVLGQGMAMLAMAVLTGLGLWLVGVPLAFLLGLITGLLNIVPYLGAILGAVPGALVALTVDMDTVYYAMAVYFVVHQLDGYIIPPIVQTKAIRLPPGLILLAVVAFGLIFGLVGVLVATPLTVVAIVWIKLLYVHDTLEKPVETERPHRLACFQGRSKGISGTRWLKGSGVQGFFTFWVIFLKKVKKGVHGVFLLQRHGLAGP